MSLLLLLVLAQEPRPCAAPVTHSLDPLLLAARADGERVLAVEKALNCREAGGPCATEVKQCTRELVAGSAKGGFDEAPYLKDLDTPYRGETFPQTRIWVAAKPLASKKCPASVLWLRELLDKVTAVHV